GAIRHGHLREFRLGTRDGAIVAVESRHGANLTVRIGAHRNAQVEVNDIVETLHVEGDFASLEIARQRHTELTAVIAVEAGVADAIVISVETATRELPVANGRAVPRIHAVQPVITVGVFDHSLRVVPDLAGNVVDCTGGGVGIEDGRGAAAHDLDT